MNVLNKRAVFMRSCFCVSVLFCFSFLCIFQENMQRMSADEKIPMKNRRKKYWMKDRPYVSYLANYNVQVNVNKEWEIGIEWKRASEQVSEQANDQMNERMNEQSNERENGKGENVCVGERGRVKWVRVCESEKDSVDRVSV